MTTKSDYGRISGAHPLTKISVLMLWMFHPRTRELKICTNELELRLFPPRYPFFWLNDSSFNKIFVSEKWLKMHRDVPS